MGGIERASCNLANSLDELGCCITYIALFKQPIFFSLRNSVKFIEPTNFNIKKLNFLRTIFWLRKMINQDKPDAIIVFNKFYAALTLLSFAFIRNTPIFTSERSSPFFQWDKKLDYFMKLVFFLFPPKGVIAQTNIAAAHQSKKYRKSVRLRVIPNILRDVKEFPEIKKENYILAVGRFNDPNKGFDQLIDAFSRIHNQSWQLVFAGGDEDGQDLKVQAERLGIIDRIIFLGKVTNIDAVFAQSKIFVIPSRSEGFPNALCEAMAAGLPCISFDFIAGPRDLINHENNGVLVENGNIQALSRAIDDLINDEQKRLKLGENAKKIRKKLNKTTVGKEILQFIFDYQDEKSA